MVKFGTSNFGINMTGTVEEIEPTKPAVDLDPIEYVKHIRSVNPGNNGRPIDIRKARQMTKADLLAADPVDVEMLLRYGVSQNQIAKIYDTPMGSLAKILRNLGVDTGVKLLVKEKFDVRKPEESGGANEPEGLASGGIVTRTAVINMGPDLIIPDTNEIITDPARIAELMAEPDPVPTQTPDEFNWFSRQPNTQGTPVVTVRANGDIYFSTEFGKLFTAGDMVEIGLTPNCHKIAVKSDGTYRLLRCDKTNASKTVSAGNIRDELQWKGMAFPAKYKMSSVGDMWTGVLIP